MIKMAFMHETDFENSEFAPWEWIHITLTLFLYFVMFDGDIKVAVRVKGISDHLGIS